MNYMIKKILNKFKPKEFESKYIKYSKSTANANPKMILHEYDILIKKREEEIETKSINDIYVDFENIWCENFGELERTALQNRYMLGNSLVILKQMKSKIKNKYKVSIRVAELKNLIEQFDEEELELAKLRDELNKIEIEKTRFEEEHYIQITYK